MGIPVLHGVAGKSAGIVTREEVGLVFPPEDAQALRDGVLRLAEDYRPKPDRRPTPAVRPVPGRWVRLGRFRSRRR